MRGSYQLELAIPEIMATRVRPGTPVQVTLDSLGSTFAAKIAEIVPRPTRPAAPSPPRSPLAQKGLKSGMFGRGTIALGTSGQRDLGPGKASSNGEP